MKNNIFIFYLLFTSNSLFALSYKLTLEDYHAGFFSTFHLVLGTLDFYERSQDADAIIIDFENFGFYYDPKHGPNWWSYYFDTSIIGSISNHESKFSLREKGAMSLYAGLVMSRERGYELIQKYMPLKPYLEEKINSFVKKNFQGNYVIGVHYRGTDKANEAPHYSFIVNLIKQEIISRKDHNLEAPIKIFVATDDQMFLNEMQKNFPEKVLYSDAARSNNGQPVHYQSSVDAFKKGEEAILDCILLSKCSKLYKPESNLSNASMKFNPTIPVIEVNPEITQYYLENM